MALSARRALLYVLLPLLVLSALGSLVFWVVYSLRSRNELVEPTQRASISLPTEPSLLTWSADGRYLAAGTGYTDGGQVHGPGSVFIVDVGKEAIAATLETAAPVDGLAFSPKGEWLAVATNDWSGEAELVVFAVPKFTTTARFKAELRKSEDGKRDLPGTFVDIAWAADGKSLFTIDSDFLAEKPRLRRWSAPDFVEQPAIPLPGIGQYKALAVAPDGHTVALVAKRGIGGLNPQGFGVLELLELDKGTTIISVEDVPFGYYRAGFSADSNTIGVFAGIEGPGLLGDLFDPVAKQKRKPQRLSWWDVGTGKLASPAMPHFALQPAAQAESRTYSISPDSRLWAHTLLWPRSFEDKAGRYVVLTQTDALKTWTWRVGTDNRPSLAFSPDGTKLSGTLNGSSGWTIAIWAVP